jgi:DNA-binding YbaB/EbfC family protein
MGKNKPKPMPQQPQQQPDMSALLKQAQKMQEQMMQARAQAEDAEIEGQSGGGVVKIKVNGAMEFLSVTIDPSAVDPADVGMLEDLVLAAIRDAVSKTAEMSEKAMGGIDLGGLGGLLGG